jgi:hypothetical protein
MTSDGVALVKMALVQKLRRQECILTSKYFFFLIISFLPLNVLDISTISLIPANPQIFKYTVIKNALKFKAFIFLIIRQIYFVKGTAILVVPHPKCICTPPSASSKAIEKASKESPDDTGTVERATSFASL